MSGTEEIDRRYLGIDRWDDQAILAALCEGQRRAIDAVRDAATAISAAAYALARRLGQGGRLIYAGAGSSIAIAVQDGAELPGTFGLERERIVFLIAGGSRSLTDIDGEAEDDAETAARAVDDLHCVPADSMIAVAASGSTPFTLAAARQAKARGALVIGIANNEDCALLRLADCPVFLNSGHEVIAGSTRMGAGTAQKAALNLLSTLTHIKLGGVMDGMMVNVRADNAKLRRRAEAIVARIAGADAACAAEALTASGGDIKPAALLCVGVASLAEAQALLARANGNLRLALELIADSPQP